MLSINLKVCLYIQHKTTTAVASLVDSLKIERYRGALPSKSGNIEKNSIQVLSGTSTFRVTLISSKMAFEVSWLNILGSKIPRLNPKNSLHQTPRISEV